MKLTIWIILAAAAMASAQVVPTTPTKFGKRIIGGGSGSADIGLQTPPKPEPIVRMTSYIALAEPKQWSSNDGKSLIGKMIAFEDLVMETTKTNAANAQPQMPALPGKPTVVKDGKIRLLVNQKPVEVPLDRLVQKDREYAEALRDRVAQSKVVQAPK